MNQYAVSNLVKEVKVILDRNQETAEMIPDDTDTLSQDEIIESVIIDAAKAIEELAPVSKLDGITKSTQNVTWTLSDDAYVGKITLPAGVLRMVHIKVSDWKRPADIISENDNAYLYQQNKYVRGNPQKPVAVLVHDGGALVLELYTSSQSTSTVDFSYVEVPSISDSNVSLCSMLKDAILYMAAYLTCISLGDTQTAAGLKATAYQLAGIVESSQTQ